MTGFDSKRQAAQDKLTDDDDTQVYSETLSLVYQHGFANGKRSAQRKPLTIDELQSVLDHCEDNRIAVARGVEAAHGIKEQP